MEAARRLVAADCGALPVVDDLLSRLPIGIVTDRDLVCRALAVGKDPLRLTVEACMSSPCIVVDMDASLADCCDTMEANQVRRLVVVDGSGRVAGIVSQADVARVAPQDKIAEVLREVSLAAAAVQSTF
jgi:CBS domain-containing protein